MGLSDVFADASDFVMDTAGKVETVAEVVELVASRTNLADVANVAKSVGKWASPLNIAPTPILVGGQKAIQGMKWMTGDGDPEWGQGLYNGSRAFKNEQQTLENAYPDSTWDGGSAPRAYEGRVGAQQNRIAILADADNKMATVVNREAGQIIETRRILDGLHNWLAQYGEYTQTLGVIPEVGKQIQMEAEMLAVSMALEDATSKMWEMHNNANANAVEVRAALEMYQNVSATATAQDSVGDFDPPR